MALGRRIHGALPYQPTQDGVRRVHGDGRSVVPTSPVVVELSKEREVGTNSSVVRGILAIYDGRNAKLHRTTIVCAALRQLPAN